jgi:hypothetical protein
MAAKKLDRLRCARLSSSVTAEIAEAGSRTAPEPGAGGAIAAGFGIEFMFPFGRLFNLHRLKRISGPEVSGHRHFGLRMVSSAFRNRYSAFLPSDCLLPNSERTL